MRIVVVSPHRDDAAFSLGLSIERWLGAGHRVQVLNCFTQSQYAPYSDVDSVHVNDRTSFASAVRKREDVAWNKLMGGRLQFTDLDMLDAPLRLACGVDEVLTVEVRAGDRAVARLAGSIAKMARAGSPESLAFALPLAVGGHIDHRVARLAGLEALAGSPLPVAFYEDLPYAARPGAYDEIAGVAGEVSVELAPAFAVGPGEDASVAVRLKRRIAECYDSQVDSEVVGQIAGFAERYGGRERVWGNAAWRASALTVSEEAAA